MIDEPKMSKLAKVVAPSFLYGSRLPQLTGLIRFNEQISVESKNKLSKTFFDRSNFAKMDGIGIIESIEVVSDETVHLSHDRNQIEAGVGLLLKTAIHLPQGSTVACGIVMNFTHVGENNDNRNYHANQAKAACEHLAREWVSKTTSEPKPHGGLVVTAHHVSDEQPIQLSEGYISVNDIRRFTVHATHSPLQNHLTIEPISSEEKQVMLSPFVHLPFLSTSACLESFGLCDTKRDTLLCGVSVLKTPHGNIRAVDPFVTTDCPTKEEKVLLTSLVSELAKRNRVRKCDIEYSGTDRLLRSIFQHDLPESTSPIVFSALPIGLQPAEEEAIRRAPWALSGLFQ
jgi:hypothetical protein